MYPFLNLFGKTVGTYAIISVLGLLICVLFTAFIIRKKKNISFDNAVLIAVIGGIGLFIGSHLLYGISNISNIKRLIYLLSHIKQYSFASFFHNLGLCFGGMVFYGGFLGSITAVYIYSKFAKDLNESDTMDIFLINVPLFHIFGRIGCFFGGCCYGIENSFGFLIDNNTANPSVNGVVRFPVQLLEAFCNLIIFLILFYILRKNIASGYICFIYVLIYAPTRFMLEFLRGDEIRGFWLGLSTSQWISILLFTFSIIFLFIKKRFYLIFIRRKA